MSHYTKDYSKLEGDAKRGAAVQDAMNYLGVEEFARVCRILQEAKALGEFERHTDKQYRVALMMVGVQHYPAQAIFELLFGVE